MARHRGFGHIKLCRQITGRHRSTLQQAQNLPADGVGKSVKNIHTELISLDAN